jgi:hypothetical protein
MHKLEHGLFQLADTVANDDLAKALKDLAGASHNYTPPVQEELDLSEEILGAISKL